MSMPSFPSAYLFRLSPIYPRIKSAKYVNNINRLLGSIYIFRLFRTCVRVRKIESPIATPIGQTDFRFFSSSRKYEINEISQVTSLLSLK
jgi:hypothetical protein